LYVWREAFGSRSLVKRTLNKKPPSGFVRAAVLFVGEAGELEAARVLKIG